MADPKLDNLQKRLDAAKHEDAAPDSNPPPKNLGLAMRVGIELVAGVGVGAAAGYFLDVWAGTLPLFLLVGFGLGCAAGFRNLKRLSDQLGQEK